MTPTQRSLALLRSRMMVACVVERFIAPRKIRVDAFGIGDILAADPQEKAIWLVQTTSAANLAAHRSKALAEARLGVWLSAGGRFVLHSWARRGRRGRRKLWTCVEEELSAADWRRAQVGVGLRSIVEDQEA